MSEFIKVKTAVRKQFDLISKDQRKLFFVQVDRDKIWELYLEGFADPVIRQDHNCNCCKSFLRQWAGIVTIKNNQIETIWDVEVDELYKQPIKNISRYIKSLPVSDVFVNTFPKLGTDSNTCTLEDGSVVRWNHFYVELPKQFVHKGSSSIEAEQGNLRDNKTVLQRSLSELPIHATETVLDLIGQNSLYRGKEFEGMLKEFLKVQQEYANIPNELRNNYCWSKSVELSPALCRIRNTSIGTLLIDISEGKDLDQCVHAFGSMMAGYKRPTTPIITPKMAGDAKKALTEAGYLESLERRVALATDLTINNVLYSDKTTSVKDVFDEIATEQVNPKSLTKVEEVSINDFIVNVLPKTKSLEVLLENSHLNSFVTLLTAQDNKVKPLFKWDNPFSWSYTGGVTDSIKERVKQAGGNVDGVFRVSLSWDNQDDLDLHIYEPNGNHIYYPNKRLKHMSSGMLDVDANGGDGIRQDPCENITWTDELKMPEGDYTVKVNNYNKRQHNNQGYTVQVDFKGEIYEFSNKVNPRNGGTDEAVILNYSRSKGLTIKGSVSKSTLTTKEKWCLKTNQWHKVKFMLLSPNHWDTQIGNKHFMFMLDKCVSDESPRGFYNEFLKEDLTPYRKFMEILGSKLKPENSPFQLSGVGFSETQRNHLYVKVGGAFNRTLKINF